jgi:hypothetical protein
MIVAHEVPSGTSVAILTVIWALAGVTKKTIVIMAAAVATEAASSL